MTETKDNTRVLVFLLAYNAEKTIASVFDRIPPSLSAYDTHVLAIDDGSSDATTSVATEYQREHADFPFPLTILTNPVNQGYGGNVKIGMHYAVMNDFDVLCLIHGDGQYPPEALPALIEPIIDDKAEVVFGSRMMQGFNALKGGMPFYKFAGNKILTWIENLFLNLDLSEFHTGLRLYSVKALRAIPFHLNSNDFHFDTEIIIQFHYAGFRFSEAPIPTFYGDEISHVNGLKYAWDVTWQATLAMAQRWNLCYQRKYDVAPKGREGDYQVPKITFSAAHRIAVDMVPDGTSVLDIGCADGLVVAALKRKSCRVTGVDLTPPPADRQPDEFITADLNDLPDEIVLSNYDRVLLLDVLGHLKEPERFAEWLHATCAKTSPTRIIATSGNIGFFANRLQLLFGFFNYGKRGILDRSHTRLFTFRSFPRLLEEAGFDVEQVVAVEAPYALAFGDNALASLFRTLNKVLLRISPGLFGYRILVVAQPRPTLELLLKAASENR